MSEARDGRAVYIKNDEGVVDVYRCYGVNDNRLLCCVLDTCIAYEMILDNDLFSLIIRDFSKGSCEILGSSRYLIDLLPIYNKLVGGWHE